MIFNIKDIDTTALSAYIAEAQPTAQELMDYAGFEDINQQRDVLYQFCVELTTKRPNPLFNATEGSMRICALLAFLDILFYHKDSQYIYVGGTYGMYAGLAESRGITIDELIKDEPCLHNTEDVWYSPETREVYYNDNKWHVLNMEEYLSPDNILDMIKTVEVGNRTFFICL